MFVWLPKIIIIINTINIINVIDIIDVSLLWVGEGLVFEQKYIHVIVIIVDVYIHTYIIKTPYPFKIPNSLVSFLL